MQTTAPVRPVSETAVQGEEPNIAYAFIQAPDKLTEPAHRILSCALKLGVLERNIEPKDWIGYFRNHFSVGFITVPLAIRGEAVASLDETFRALKLPGHYSIAARSADNIWVPVRGLTDVDFERAFNDPAAIQRYINEAIERDLLRDQTRAWIAANLQKAKTPPPADSSLGEMQ